MVDHLERHNANVARAMHQLGAESTAAFEGGRDKVAGVPQRAVARRGGLHQERLRGAQPGRQHAGLGDGPLAVGEGDEVVITEMEHHSNIVPWQLLTERTGATLRWFGADRRRPARPVEHRRADHRAHQGRLADLGVQHARHDQPGRRDRPPGPRGRRVVVVDASQAVAAAAGRRRPPRVPTSLAFTGHKVVGPTGIGVLWGRRELLDQLPPFLGGGEMIETVTMERSTYAAIPHKFEAGTPPIVEAVGLGAAVDYLTAPRHGQRRRARAGDHRRTRSRGSATVSGPDRARPAGRRRSAGERSRSSSTASTRTTSPAARHPRHRRPRRSPLRQAGARAVRRAELDPRRRRTSTRRRPRSTRSSRALEYTKNVLQGGLTRWTSTPCTRRSSWTTTSTPTTRACASPFEAEVHHVNPTCGDEVTLRVHLDGETRVEDVSYDAEGCSISQAVDVGDDRPGHRQDRSTRRWPCTRRS